MVSCRTSHIYNNNYYTQWLIKFYFIYNMNKYLLTIIFFWPCSLKIADFDSSIMGLLP